MERGPDGLVKLAFANFTKSRRAEVIALMAWSLAYALRVGHLDGAQRDSEEHEFLAGIKGRLMAEYGHSRQNADHVLKRVVRLGTAAPRRFQAELASQFRSETDRLKAAVRLIDRAGVKTPAHLENWALRSGINDAGPKVQREGKAAKPLALPAPAGAAEAAPAKETAKAVSLEEVLAFIASASANEMAAILIAAKTRAAELSAARGGKAA